MKPGMIVEVRINDSVRAHFEWEGNLDQLYDNVDSLFEAWDRGVERKHPDQKTDSKLAVLPILRRIFRGSWT